LEPQINIYNIHHKTILLKKLVLLSQKKIFKQMQPSPLSN